MIGCFVRWVGSVAWVVLLTMPGRVALSEPTTVDQILVVVNGQPITRSRLSLFYDYLTVTHGRWMVWSKSLVEVETLSLEDILEIVIRDELLFDSANQIERLPVRGQALEQRVEQFRTLFRTESEYEAFVERHSLTPDLLREFFGRRLRIEAHIAIKVGSCRPSDAELTEYYQEHGSEVSMGGFDEERERLVEIVSQKKASAEFEQWVGKLKARAVIQVPGQGGQH